MRIVLKRLMGQDGEVDSVKVIGYSGNEGVRKVLKEIFTSSLQKLHNTTQENANRIDKHVQKLVNLDILQIR